MYYLTQSLLSSWQYFMDVEDPYSETAYGSFLSALRREKKPPTKPILDGIAFEDAVNATVRAETPEVNPKWEKAVRRFSKICAGGQPQVPVSGVLRVCGLNIGVYGLCDYVKAGTVYDIKKVTRYEYGKYFHSPQHPMYMRLLPEAKKFVYLIFDGTNTYTETYRPGDYRPIEEIISEFIGWLHNTSNFEDYEKYWTMNDERKEKIYGLQF